MVLELELGGVDELDELKNEEENPPGVRDVIEVEGLVAEEMDDKEDGVGSTEVDTTPFAVEVLCGTIDRELVSLGTWEPAEPVMSSILETKIIYSINNAKITVDNIPEIPREGLIKPGSIIWITKGV